MSLEQLKALARPGFFPCSSSVSCPHFKEPDSAGCHIDFEPHPPMIIHEPHEKTEGCWGQPMTADDISAAIDYFTKHPPHPRDVTADDVLMWLTTTEEMLLSTHAKKVAHMLFARNTPIPWDGFIAVISALVASGLITAERREQIIRGVAVE